MYKVIYSNIHGLSSDSKSYGFWNIANLNIILLLSKQIICNTVTNSCKKTWLMNLITYINVCTSYSFKNINWNLKIILIFMLILFIIDIFISSHSLNIGHKRLSYWSQTAYWSVLYRHVYITMCIAVCAYVEITPNLHIYIRRSCPFFYNPLHFSHFGNISRFVNNFNARFLIIYLCKKKL